jgi:hypothetical protein
LSPVSFHQVIEEAQGDTILFIKYRSFARLAVKLTGASSSLQHVTGLFQPLHERIVDQIPCLDLGKTRIDPAQSIDHVLNSAHRDLDPYPARTYTPLFCRSQANLAADD